MTKKLKTQQQHDSSIEFILGQGFALRLSEGSHELDFVIGGFIIIDLVLLVPVQTFLGNYNDYTVNHKFAFEVDSFVISAYLPNSNKVMIWIIF